MKGAGLVADTVIYTILIDGYCRNGNVAEALNVRKEMVERGVFAECCGVQSRALWDFYLVIVC